MTEPCSNVIRTERRGDTEWLPIDTPHCLRKPPEGWSTERGLRWLTDGGSPEVFGPCTPTDCPLQEDT